MNKMKIKIFALLSLIITFSLVLSSCDSLWDDLSNFTVSFDSNTGTGTMESQIFEANVPQALNENKFTKDGYTFAGWATKADASEAEYADKANFTAKEDTTLYAIWNVIPSENPPENPPAPVPITFTITYVSDKGTLPKSKTVDQGYKLTAEDLKELSEAGYRFIGWDKAIDDEISSDTTITASWIKTWNISYTSNKSELNDKLPTSKTVDEGYKLTADDLTALTADGYNFKGWDKSVGAEIKADMTITASWVKTWKITYSSTAGTKPADKYVEEGYKLVAADLPKIETDTEYSEWDKTVGTKITANTTITATNWEPIVYLKMFTNIDDIKNNKTKIERIIFTTDSYTGTSSFDCADNSTNTAIDAGYFKGVLTDGATAGQYILTIYGNGHRIYAPEISSSLFSGFSKVTNIEFNNFYTSKVTNMQQMFTNCKLLVALDLSSFDTSSVTNMVAMFSGCSALTSLDVSSFNTSNVTNMWAMFMNLSEITELNLSNFDTSNVTDMHNMFKACKKLTGLNLSSFNTSSVEQMNEMFNGCLAIESLDVSKFNTSAVTNMASMFCDCKALKELNLSSFDTSAVTNMASMFQTAELLEKVIFSSKFKTENVTDMCRMFINCSRLVTIDLSSFDTSSVTDMHDMFSHCSSLTTLDLSSFTKGKLTNSNEISNLFDYCTNLTTICVSSEFDLSTISPEDTIIFDSCSKLVGGAGTKYSDIKESDELCVKKSKYARIDGGPSNPGYFTLKQ